jgi:membrane-bound metal-dependent hydrolase YbcI (DUF457 family)
MAREHSESGLVVGLVVADLAHVGILAGIAAAILTAGAALLPDLDHPSATAARTFGPVTRYIAQRVDHFGYWTWECTHTRYDRQPRDGHRTITHTTVFAVLAGVIFGAVAIAGMWAILAELLVLTSLAVRGLAARGSRELRASRKRRRGRRFRATMANVTAVGASLAALIYTLDPALDPLLVGECVALGCWVHCLGDSLTLYGCPWLWPLKIKGQRWYLIGTPQALRFRTGTDEFDGEDRVRIMLHIGAIAAAIGLLPGAYSWIWQSATAFIR